MALRSGAKLIFETPMSNDNEVLVKVEGVSKIFCRDLKKSLYLHHWAAYLQLTGDLHPLLP